MRRIDPTARVEDGAVIGEGTAIETLRGEFRMPDGDFLEVLDTPKIAIHADRPEIERGDAERLRFDFAIQQ